MSSRPISRLLRLTRSSRRRRIPRARPALERLEARTLPTSFLAPWALTADYQGLSDVVTGDFNCDGKIDVVTDP